MRDVLGQRPGAVLVSQVPWWFFLPCLQKYHISACRLPFMLSSGLSLPFFFFSPPCLPCMSFSLNVSRFWTPLFQEKGLFSKQIFLEVIPWWVTDAGIAPSPCPFLQILHSVLVVIGHNLKSKSPKGTRFYSHASGSLTILSFVYLFKDLEFFNL